MGIFDFFLPYYLLQLFTAFTVGAYILIFSNSWFKTFSMMNMNNQAEGNFFSEFIPMKKRSQGRKKIEIKKIADHTQLQVTFSKRRNGVFKKASELCVLCDALVAVIVTSPGGNVFAFGHPSVDDVINLYLTGNLTNRPSFHDYSEEYSQVLRNLEENKSEFIQENVEDRQWWDESIDNMELEELELYESSMEELKNNIVYRANQLSTTESSPLMYHVNPDDHDHDNDNYQQSCISDNFNYLDAHTDFDPFNS